MALLAIRIIAASTKSAISLVHLRCHIKPGASKQREGVISVSDSVVDVCVSAQAKDGDANKAVREVFSNVGVSILFIRCNSDVTSYLSVPSPTSKSFGV